MPDSARKTYPRIMLPAIVLCITLALCGCGTVTGKGKAPPRDVDVADVVKIPQRFSDIATAAGRNITISDACRSQLLLEFQKNFFRPWTATSPLFDVAETKAFMVKEARGTWYGVNRRKVPRKQLQRFLENCDLDTFPARNDPAIAVAPCHLRGLPTELPLYEPSDGPPFDMLSYPQIKLNEPLRVMHVSRDGIWFFVESAYSNGWVERRDVAFVDRPLIDSWMESPFLVMVKDHAPIPDGRGVATFPAKTGTLLPLQGSENGCWKAMVASAADGGSATACVTRIDKDAAAPFPLPFEQQNVTLIGDQLIGQPYGWGEIYGLRDCSALVRDFFLPFGIWMPRTALDQITSVRRRVDLASLDPEEKEEVIKSKGVPFLTLLYKRGHIMLYVGMDNEGRPLVFQDAWSIRVREGKKERQRIIGGTVITTLKPGEELGLVPGGSLLERASEMATVTERCR